MRKADNLPPSCAVVMKSGKLNFLEPSGPVQASNGTDLPFLPSSTEVFRSVKKQSHYRPEVPGGFHEVMAPRLRDNGTGWW